jgi:hypothetical protein
MEAAAEQAGGVAAADVAGHDDDVVPTPASIAWTPSAVSRFCVVLRVSRCTDGFETPDAATRLVASRGSYGVHAMLASNPGLVVAIGVQPGCPAPPPRTFTSVRRSITSSNAFRSFAFASGLRAFAHGR